METRKGNVLFFLTVLMCSAGVCVTAQDNTAQSNTTASAPVNSTNNSNVTAMPTNSSVPSTNATSPMPSGNSTELANSTSSNTTSSTPTVSNQTTTAATMTNATSASTVSNQTTSAAAVTNATSAPTTTVQSTPATDYCVGTPCHNGSCSSLPTKYVCSCNRGWTGDNCENELVLWPDYMTSSSVGFNINKTTSTIPFAYFNRAVTFLGTNVEGYTSFGRVFNSRYAPEGTAWPYFLGLFGIYWTDIDTQNNASSFYYSLIERNGVSNVNSSSLVQYVKEVVNVSSFEPLIIIVATWVDVMPEPAANFSNDKATYQLILASDTQYSYAIRNYQKVWGNLGFYGRPRVSAAYSTENGSKQSLGPPQNKTGKLVTPLFTSGTPTTDPYICIQKIQDVSSSLGNAIRSLPKCPCLVSQVKADSWFQSVNASSSCYLSVFADRTGLKQQCCYNSFGLLNGNSKEASVPVQVNPSNVSLMEAFEQCCNKTPQLCPWFYYNFPSSDCRQYTVPYTGVSFGKTYTETFDNNKYSFNGFGDFVLFKSGEVEIQIKTQINANTNTTSIQALAIKTADNTSSIQFYPQSSNLTQSNNLTWSFTSSPVTRPDSNTYILSGNYQPSITLWLPTVYLTVTNMGGFLSCIIRFNRKDSNSQGLLGTADGNSTNDFRVKNGIDLSSTAERLSPQNISDFALSWQVNATESLFDIPSLPANVSTNSTTQFMPLPLPANVNDTLNKINNESVRAEVSNLCKKELFCVQEYYTSSSYTSALAILQFAENISDSKAQASMKAPTFANTDSTLSIVINGSSPYTLKLAVQDGMTVIFNKVDSFMNITGFHLDNSTFTWNVSADLTMLRTLSYPRNLKFYATNNASLSAEYAPSISLCLCEQASQCVQTNDTTANGNVNIQSCSCGDRAVGRFCEIPVDPCTNCYNKTACNATNLNNYCAPCPNGYDGDGKYCLDKNECLDGTSGCEEFCTNTPGSFQCFCKPGYAASGTRCTDIDECIQDINICKDYLKVCINTPGSYACACFPTLVGEKKCIKAPYSYAGEIELAVTIDQVWNNTLNDKNSAYFKDLSGRVAESITERLTRGSIGTNDTLFVETLSFSQGENAVRTKRQASNSRLIAMFVIYLANNNITADEINAVLRNGNETTCNGSCQYINIIIITYPQVNSSLNLCNYPQIHKCDLSTTVCVQSGHATSCNCTTGYQPSPSDSHSCRDVDECAGNATNTCPQTGVCINKPGSFMCGCNEGQYWDANATQCAADGCAAKPCQNGVCYPLRNSTDFTCKCNSGYEGGYCEDEDAEAYRFKVAVICISVILGVLCLVLLIILIVMCVRKHRNGSDWTLENDSYTNSRYSEAEHLPRVKIAHRPGTEMSENGNTYDRLSSGSVEDKQTFFGQHAPTPNSRDNGPKGVYQNRAYEEDAGERL